MTLVIGQALMGRDVEQETSAWPPERFASMCDAIAWAESGKRVLSLPSFTSRVNAPDGGIDTEWAIEMPIVDSSPISTPLIGSGWNVFQYKKRDLIASDRSRIVLGLSSAVTGAIGEILQRWGKIPDRYVLFVNVDLKHDQKRKLKQTILKDISNHNKLHIEIVGAAELAAFLNNNPHLRAAYFSPISFKTWQEAYTTHKSHKILGASVDFIGREEEKRSLQNLIQDESVRIIILAGPHDIGKTRLVLEATRERPHDVVVALDPRSMTLSDYRGLCSTRGETICIVEDPDPGSLERLFVELLGTSNLKLIVTLPSPSLVPGQSYQPDKRIEVIPLGPLGEKESYDLVRASEQPMDFGTTEWIVARARGFPGIILAAASVGPELKREPGGFITTVGKELTKRIKIELGDEAAKAAEIFSILTYVGISGDWEDEINYVCDIFGDGMQPRDAIRELEALEQAGLARRVGSFAEITLSLLGNYLAGQAFLGRKKEIFSLYERLADSGRERFISRLSEMPGNEVTVFWHDFLDTTGPFGNFDIAIQKPHLLRIVAGAVPTRVVRLLESGIVPKSKEERLLLRGKERRELLFALEQLLFRKETSREAMHLIWLLAEAENESYGNNASGVLKECFQAMHVHMPLPLDERLAILKEFTSDKASKEGRIVAIEAVEDALRTGGYLLREGAGIQPLDERPQFTYKELDHYISSLIDLMLGLADDMDKEVAETSLKVLPKLIWEYCDLGSTRHAVEKLEILANMALNGREGLEVSRVFDAIRYMLDALNKRTERGGSPDEAPEELKKSIGELKEIKAKLERGTYDLRLKRWAGAWSVEDGDDVQLDGMDVPRYEVEIEHLAEEAAKKPEFLSDPLMSWLLSDSSQKSHLFFHFLGKHNRICSFRKKIEQIGKMPNGHIPFSAYWGGWANRDPESADSRIEELSLAMEYPAEPIVRATARMKATESGVKRVIRLIQDGRISGSDAGRLLAGPWTKDLNRDQFTNLVEVIAGADLQGATGVLYILSEHGTEDRFEDDKIIDIAWRSLEAAPEWKPALTEWDLDKLAAKLAKKDPRRGVRLLESLLRRAQSSESWNPMEMHPKHRFWDALYDGDKESLFKMLFDASLKDPLLNFEITWELKRILDLEKDGDFLISYAKRNQSIAEMISGSISTKQEGFWRVAEELIRLYPNNEKIERYVRGAIMRENEGGTGLPSQAYNWSKGLVEARINDPNTSTEFRAFLKKALVSLDAMLAHDFVWEYDMDIAGIKRHIEDKNSSDRIWAIGRVLKYGGPEDWRKLLSVEDIEEALPQIDLPEKKRKVIERALPYWQNHV